MAPFQIFGKVKSAFIILAKFTTNLSSSTELLIKCEMYISTLYHPSRHFLKSLNSKDICQLILGITLLYNYSSVIATFSRRYKLSEPMISDSSMCFDCHCSS